MTSSIRMLALLGKTSSSSLTGTLLKPDSYIMGKDTIDLDDWKSPEYSGPHKNHANLIYNPILFDSRNEQWITVVPGTGGNP
ncbi:MAG: hypothetical protein HN725_10585 [Alphaproteobacteria bacterium]|nr:hypothetical protein [Alphaproteobacteria bacterium]MBT4543177.1 hypothetical protein [Alphaproteobacteria bacterium]MBT7745728.1 hypothetical protein [Alphaproteobacteria bacterium]